MPNHPFTRRDFVGSMAAAGVTFHIVPRHVLGRGFRAPSDTLNVACIGAGGMGRSDVRGMAEAGHNIYALCDVDDERAADAYRSHPDAKRYKDFRELFDREAANIDAVTVSTPDHTHAAASLLAIDAGKPTRTQKPLTRTLGEVRALAAAARERGVPTQMGNQGHANEGTRLIREWVEAGLIGTVREVHFWTNRPIWPQALDRPLETYHVPSTLDWNLWLGPAPERPYNPAYAPFRWRGWWDFGTGALGDMACHIMDAAFWTLDLGTPSRVVPESTAPYRETAPNTERITYYFDAKDGRPAVKCVWRDGSLFPPRPPEVANDDPWPPDSGGGQLWIGDEGKLVADTYGRSPMLLDAERRAEVRANPLPQTYPRTEGTYAEFVTAATGGTPPGSTFEGHGGALTEMVLLGVLAVRLGRTLDLDPATGAIVNVDVPPEWITPTYRAGWSL